MKLVKSWFTSGGPYFLLGMGVGRYIDCAMWQLFVGYFVGLAGGALIVLVGRKILP